MAFLFVKRSGSKERTSDKCQALEKKHEKTDATSEDLLLLYLLAGPTSFRATHVVATTSELPVYK